MRVTSNAASSLLLAAGVILTPIFFAIVLAQMVTRDGFDITKHAISLLSLGDGGWVQSGNFLLAGVLAIALSVGLVGATRGGPARIWGPLLVATFGVGIMAAGLFTTDPAMGFPPGAPEGRPATMTSHALIHSMAFYTSFVALIGASFVFARGFKAVGSRPWERYSTVSGYGTILFIVLGMTVLNSVAGLCFVAAALIAMGWLSATAWQLRRTRQPADPGWRSLAYRTADDLPAR